MRFILKAPIFSRQGLFQARSVLEATYYHLRVLGVFSFFAIISYSEIEIGLFSLYRSKVITTFKLNEKIVRFRYPFPRRKA